MVSLTKSVRVAITGLCLLACMFATFYFLIVLKTGIIYVHLFYLPIVLVTAWWYRKGIILTFSLVLFLLICNSYFAPHISIVNNLERAAILLFVGVLTSTMFKHRERREEELRETKNYLNNLLNYANAPIIVWDNKKGITLFNNAFEAFTGYNKEAMLGRNIDFLFPSLQKEEILRTIEKATKGEKWKSVEIPILCKDKETKVALWNSANITGKEGKIVATIAQGQDITKRKMMEKAIRESREKFERLFMGNPEAAVYADQDSRVLDVNPRFTEIFGYSSDEVKGKRLKDLIVPENMMEDAEIVTKKTKKGHVYRDTVRKRKGGSLVPVSISAAPIVMAGKLTGAVILYKDITERRRAEQALSESEELYRTLVYASPDAIIVGDLTGKIMHVNPQAIKMNRFEDEEEMISLNSFDHIVPEDREKAMRNLTKTLETGITRNTEYTLIRKDGMQYPAELSNTLIRDAKGKPQAFLSVIRDITERKKMEEKLEQYSEHLEELVQKRTEEFLESEKKYSVLVEEASDGVVIRQDGKNIFVNKKALELVDYSNDEVIGLPFEKLIEEKYLQLTKERYERKLRGEKVASTCEIEVIAKNGERVPVELSATRINYQGHPADLIIVRDIRERKRMEEQRSKLEKLATMSELATMVAHDLRNPLTSIRTAGYYIRTSCPYYAKPECKTVCEMLDIIEQETLFADNIINDLLDFATKRPFQKKKQNINELVEASLIVSNIPENIKLKTKLVKKAIVTVDEKQLQRVFLNVIKNAVQAMPNGGKLTIKTSEIKDHIKIAFTDTGVGMPEENMSKIFTPLFTTKAKGIGMGLAICKRIVEQHNGTIDVKSKVGEGTTFTIKLPKKEENNQ